MRYLSAVLIMLGGLQAVAAQAPFSFCADNTVCSGATSQCAPNNTGWKCCAPGAKVIKGVCRDSSSTLCADGTTVCSGNTPQCTTNRGIFDQGKSICCANGEQAIDKKCYAGNKRLTPCYADGPCDLDKMQYCAWTTTGGYSRCCQRNQYLNNGYNCQKKP